MIISLDTETTGLDLRHGAKPFLVTICREDGSQSWWEWDVVPETREPIVIYDDLQEIQNEITKASLLVLQSPKFDVAALQTIFLGRLKWDWKKTRDTQLAGYLLASNQPHDLTTMAMTYLRLNVKPYEDAIQQAVNEARRLCSGKHPKYPDWMIARKGLPCMPSAKGSVWKNDMWLPRAIAKEEEYDDDHPWWSLVASYANSDSETTLALYITQKRILKERKLWKIYRDRIKILPVVYAVESLGVTYNRTRLKKLETEYRQESDKANAVCISVAKSYGYDLKLPKGSVNNSLRGFIFGEDGLDLEPFKKSKKTDAPSLDASCMEHYVATLPEKSKPRKFIENLAAKRKRDTALSYMESYERFGLPLPKHAMIKHKGKPPSNLSPWYILHPSLNPTGTDTTRWSSQNPNEQNISKKDGFNLRYCFGPAPGREWWAIDYDNLELRLAAYQAGEAEMIYLFERPEVGPCFGSYHLLVFDTLHRKRLKLDTGDPQYLIKAKKKYATTWYQWTKNGNFAVQYGAQVEFGTADRAYHVPGGQAIISDRFQEIAKLNHRMIQHAKDHGFVETMADGAVDPERGYPLLAGRTKYGKLRETTPLNYNIQGTACWLMQRAMVKVYDYLQTKPDHHMIMNVHDEIVFDFPKDRKRNLKIIQRVRKIMESVGKSICVPLTCGIDYHPVTWSEGVAV